MQWLSRIRRSHLAWQLVVAAGVVLLLGLALKTLAAALTPLLGAMVVAYAMAPLVARLERLRLGRVGAIVCSFVLLAVGFGLFLLWLIPSIISELSRFELHLPGSLAELRAKLEPLLARFDTKLPTSFSEIGAQLGGQAQAIARASLSAVGGVAAGAMAVGSSLANLLLIPLFTFYLLKDSAAIRDDATSLIPPRHREAIGRLVFDLDQTLSAFIRGQLTVMLIQSVLYAVGLSIVGIDLAVVIGVLTGLLSFVPYVGLALGLVMALVMALLSIKGTTALVGVLVVFGLVAVIDAILITPRVLGGKVGLSPPAIIIGLLIAGSLFGFLGVLLAVPLTAVVKILAGRATDAYRASAFYAGAPSLDLDPPDSNTPGGPVA